MRVKADCPSHSWADIAIRDLSLAIDEPVERGGTNAGPTPTDTALIGHKYADKLGVDIGHLEVSASCSFDRRGVTLEEEIEVPFRRIDLTVHSHGSATQESLDLVAREVKKYCPLSKLFSAAGTEIVENWQPAG